MGKAKSSGRAVLLAAVVSIGLASSAAAQMVPPCMNDLAPLRDEAAKRGQAIKAGVERKVPREALCQLFTRFAVAEANFVKYIEKNAGWCGIPPTAVTQIRANHARTMKTKTQVCSTAGPGGAPAGPSLSDALGLDRPPPVTKREHGGTLDTLTGNPIK
jgi:hypothetical protein